MISHVACTTLVGLGPLVLPRPRSKVMVCPHDSPDRLLAAITSTVFSIGLLWCAAIGADTPTWEGDY